MNKNYILMLVTVSAIGGLAFTKMTKSISISESAYKNSHLRNASGAPSGMTVAPGESNCTSCHSGSVQSGTGFNNLILIDQGTQLPVTQYTPGTTYSVAITLATPAPKNGFQVSPRIVSNNTQAGTSVGVPTVSSVASSGGKQYINHTSQSNTSQSGWIFTWTAPATNVGDVRFYMSSNVTNNNFSTSGDVIRTSQHTFSAVSGAGISSNKADEAIFSVGFNQAKNALKLDFNVKENASFFLNLVDLNGKSVMSKKLTDVKIGDNSQEISLPQELNAGIYVVHFFENNNSYSKKVYIGK